MTDYHGRHRKEDQVSAELAQLDSQPSRLDKLDRTQGDESLTEIALTIPKQRS